MGKEDKWLRWEIPGTGSENSLVFIHTDSPLFQAWLDAPSAPSLIQVRGTVEFVMGLIFPDFPDFRSDSMRRHIWFFLSCPTSSPTHSQQFFGSGKALWSGKELNPLLLFLLQKTRIWRSSSTLALSNESTDKEVCVCIYMWIFGCYQSFPCWNKPALRDLLFPTNWEMERGRTGERDKRNLHQEFHSWHKSLCFAAFSHIMASSLLQACADMDP